MKKELTTMPLPAGLKSISNYKIKELKYFLVSCLTGEIYPYQE